MAEQETVVIKDLCYEGLFDAKELYTLIDNFFEERNYDKNEIKNVEVVKKEHKFIEIIIEPYKKYTDYFKNVVWINMQISELTEVEIKKKNLKTKVNHGKLSMTIEGYLYTDYEGKWETKPVYFFFRTLFNKFFYKPYTQRYMGSVGNDVNTLYHEIKAFLNFYKK
jgi:hypothetical protein